MINDKNIQSSEIDLIVDKLGLNEDCETNVDSLPKEHDKVIVNQGNNILTDLHDNVSEEKKSMKRRIHLKVTKSQKIYLNQYAIRKGCSVSHIVEELIKKELDKHSEDIKKLTSSNGDFSFNEIDTFLGK